MTKFARLPVLFLLLGIFLVAFLLGGPENASDVAAIHQLREIRTESPQLTSLIVILTQLGSAYATLGLGTAAAAWLFLRGDRGIAVLLAATVFGERLVMDGFKIIAGRPRPAFDAHPVMTHSSSFPSGHSANSMAVFVAIALIVAPPAWRRPVVAFAALMAVLIGASRPYLGVHWPSDVIGGWALGLIAVWIALKAGERSGLLVKAQHQVVGRHLPPGREEEAA